VPPIELLTIDDIEALERSASEGADHADIVGRLLAAVDESRLVDAEDASYALVLAAELAEKRGDLDEALRLAEWATRADAPADYYYPKALYGRLLLKVGRENEGMATLAALRPLLIRDDTAIITLSDALQEAGRADVAVDWLTAPLRTLVESRRDTTDPVVVYMLAQERHELRRALDLPHDDLDDLADKLEEAVEDDETDEDDEGDLANALLFWPRAEFERLCAMWPRLAEVYGRDWDDHRTRVEAGQVLLARPGVGLVPGTVDGLSAFAALKGADPTDLAVCRDYALRIGMDAAAVMPWPPGRNEPCWCDSGQKYKRCCLPRSRNVLDEMRAARTGA
jgi:hypothetical protein